MTENEQSGAANSGNRTWTSEKWRYSVTFPQNWTRPRSTGPGVLSPGVDVYSQRDDGASTAVFCYAYHPQRDIDALTDELISNYRNKGRVSVIGRTDRQRDDIRYRVIEFRFCTFLNRFVAHDTIVFCPNMQLVVSSNVGASRYEQCKETFSGITESLQFHSTPSDELPIREENTWLSETWGYSITFPKTWNDYKCGPFSDLHAAEIRCDSWWGCSTAVFPSPRNKSFDMDQTSNPVLDSYRKRARDFKLVESKDSTKNKSQYRTTVFDWIAPDRQRYIGHYTVVLTPEILLLISSQTKEKFYISDKKDFQSIVDSLGITES